MKQEFEMQDSDLEALIQASQPVMLIALNCGTPKSPRENANAAWEALGERMHFDYLTVEPIPGKGDKFFRAEPTPDKNAIPQMTHKLSSAWDQPNIKEITIDDESALMTEATWNKLKEYSMSIPSGVYAGKIWKAIYRDGEKCLLWYTDSAKPDHCDINTRTALIV